MSSIGRLKSSGLKEFIAATTIAETTTLEDKLPEIRPFLEEIELGLCTGFVHTTALWADYTSRIYLPRDRPGTVSG